MSKIRTTITMDEKLFKEITDISKEEQRSFSRQLVYLAKKGKESEFKEDLAKVKAELKG